MFDIETAGRPAAPPGVDAARCRLDDDPPDWLSELAPWQPDPADVLAAGADKWPESDPFLVGLTATDVPPEPPGPLESMAERIPSGWLAVDLDQGTAGLSGLSDAELIDAMVGWERIGSWAAARQVRVLAEFARRRPGDDPLAVMCRNPCVGSEWAPDEVGLALRLSRGTAMSRLGRAASLVGPLAATLALLESGRLDVGKAFAICDTVAFLPVEVAVAVQDRVLPKAPDQTVAQLRAALARAVIAFDPRGAAERHRKARQQRHVRLTERDDGMASLWALLSAPDAMASYEWLSRLARSLGADDPREMDARRADLLVDLLTGRLELHTDPDPIETDPAEGDYAESDPADLDPRETNPDEDCSTEGRSDEGRSDDGDHVKADHGEAGPTDGGPGEAGPVEADLARSGPAKPGPAKSRSAETKPAEADSDEAARAKTDVAEGDSSPVEPADTKPPDGGPGGGDLTTDPDPAADSTAASAADSQDPGARRPDTCRPGTDPTGPSPQPPSPQPPSPRPPPQPSPAPADRDRMPSRAGPRPAAAGKPLIHVTIPYTTLIGIDDEPAELAGYGPIPAELAREIAADGVWKRLVTDPLSGALLDHGRTTYRPPAALADHVRARDGHCRFPTCRRQAHNCELDHIVSWADGGVTADHNLSNGCTHHHHTKHRPGWTVRMLDDGRIRWTTPTGHHYLADPHDYRPTNDPDPPLLRRPTGKDPVPDLLHDKPTPKLRRLRPTRGRLSTEAVFGRTQPDPDRSPPRPEDPVPF